MVNSKEFRDLPPSQMVPRLADRGTYLASETTIYRILREEKMLTHRSPSTPARHVRPKAYTARGPNQIWSWDITYLPSRVKGRFYYLYVIMDIYSRKIVGWAVHDCESSEFAAQLVQKAYRSEGIDSCRLVLHSDNGSPMKGATMLATLQRLGVVPSFSRPSVSNDNPFSEALFRILKYRPEYPWDRFKDLQGAHAWTGWFVQWYNQQHRHSGLKFVTPDQCHRREDRRILKRRALVYQKAKATHRGRWSGATRDWTPADVVHLNPGKGQAEASAAA